MTILHKSVSQIIGDKSPKLFLFDLDGTLSHFPKAGLYGAAQRAAVEHGVRFSEEELDFHFSNYDFFGVVDHLIRDAFISSVGKILDNQWHGSLELFPGTDRVLETLSQQFSLGIATARIQCPDLLKVSLLEAQIAHHFDTVCTRAHESIHWTDKSSQIAKALAEANVYPEETIFVGDTPDDIRSAKTAGLGLSIAVRSGFILDEKLLEVEPDLLLDSVLDLLA